MSAPLVPSKTCCTEQQDNSNAAKNDNESVTGLGDTNANQIFSIGRVQEQVEICNSTEKTRTLCTWQSENLTRSNKEQSTPLDCSEESLSSDLVLSDQRPHTPTYKDFTKDYMTDDAKDRLNACFTHGYTQLSSKSSTYDRSSVIPINRAIESSRRVYSNNGGNVTQAERLKSISLAKSGTASTKTEPFIKEHTSPIPARDSPSKYMQCLETSTHRIRTTDASQNTPLDHLFGLSSHPLNNTSEEKKIVFYSKPPTSDTSVQEFSTDEGILSNVNKQSTLQHSTNIHNLSPSTHKPQVICSVSEAQVYQGQIHKPSELLDSKFMQYKSICQKKTEHMMLVELAGSKRVENMSEIRTSPLQYPCGHVDGSQSNKVAKQAEKFVCSSPKISHFNHGNRRQDEFSVDKLCDESKIQCSQVGAHQDSDSLRMGTLKNKESNLTPAVRKTTSLNESLDNTVHLNKDRVLVEDYLCQDSDNNFLSSSSVSSLKDATVLVHSKKTTIGRKHQSDVLKGNIKESHKESSDTFVCAPTPSSPIAAVNINDQCIASLSSFKDLGAVHVDRLSPSSVLPPIESTQLFNISPKATNKTLCNSGIPKPILIHSKPSSADKGIMEINYSEKTEETIEPNLIIPKPKHVRPKIITYIRRNPQTVDRLPFEQIGMPFGTPTCSVPMPKEHETLSNDLKTSNMLLDKYKADLQKSRIYSAGLMVSGIRPPGHQFGQEAAERPRKEEFCSPTFAHYEVPPSFYRSAMILKPQLGLGAVSRLPSAKSRILIASQRSSNSSIPQQEQVTAAGSENNPDASGDLKKGSIPSAAKSNLPKPCPSGLRPPGYSCLPAAKLAAFGFVRSSSVSSLSSNQSNESVHNDQNRASNRSSFANEEQSTQKTALPSKDIPKGTSRTVLQVCSSTTFPRRSLLPAPKTTITPAGLKKEVQKDHEVIKPTVSSPKRQGSSATKLQSPGHPKLRPSMPKNGYATKPEVQTREAERQIVQKLKEKCEEQSKKFLCVQDELKKASCAFVVFAVTTQYFFKKNETGLMKEKELSIELATIRDEVAFNTARCEKLQKENEELEIKFDHEVRKLEHQQREELQALKDRLQLKYNEEIERLKQEQILQFLRIRSQHQEQIEDMAVIHEIALSEIKQNHSTAITAMHDDHENRVQDAAAVILRHHGAIFVCAAVLHAA
ncbi:microtubule-associated tumor suppressor candidate 2 isoform X2 [Ascaphus truei]|uniref:microtubule-associated tumor suppressor candidate 2 isoform X2 n=1 Tax=Ascaphus truei TaxID=8439 RepID=UPI003F59307B